MKVVIVTTWFPTVDRPWVAPFLVAHARAIARVHDVEIVHARIGSTQPRHDDTQHGLPVVRLPLRPRDPAGVARGLESLRSLLRDADVVHSMAFSTVGVLAPLYPLISDRWVHSEHWSGIARPESVGGWWPRVAAARHLLRLPRRVSAVSGSLAATLGRFARPGVARVIPCVVDDSFTAAPQPGWEPLKLVAVGGLVTGKRPLLAVDTVRLLAERGVDVSLTWIGDGPLRGDAGRRAVELEVADRVVLAGRVMPTQVAAHVREANVFFLPTAGETFLAAAAEAIACGRPVVLPDAGGFTDYVSRDNGIITSHDDPATLATAILDVRDRFAGTEPQEIRHTVLPRFSPETVAEQFSDFYRDLPG